MALYHTQDTAILPGLPTSRLCARPIRFGLAHQSPAGGGSACWPSAAAEHTQEMRSGALGRTSYIQPRTPAPTPVIVPVRPAISWHIAATDLVQSCWPANILPLQPNMINTVGVPRSSLTPVSPVLRRNSPVDAADIVARLVGYANADQKSTPTPAQARVLLAQLRRTTFGPRNSGKPLQMLRAFQQFVELM